MQSQGTSVRFALLALLAAEPGHGYALKQRFERVVGDVWPLNIGQVYDALGKLERDGLVRADDERDGTRRGFAITEAGATSADAWLSSAPEGGSPPRDELAIRLLVARSGDPAGLARIVQRQREVVVQRIQQLGRDRTDAAARGDAAREAIVDLLLLRLDADARWLERFETRFTTPKATDTR